MNYLKIYDHLMARAADRVIDGYTELHHIVPRCMGGTDKRSNLVRLTAEEHFVAHQLLVRIYPDVRKLAFAMLAMTFNYRGMRPNNKAFGWMRRVIAQALSEDRKGVPRCPDMMAKIWAGNRGRVMPEDERQRLISALKGKPHSPEHNAKVGRKGRKSPMTGRTHSTETKERMRLAALARKHKPETIEKLTAFAASLTQEERSARAIKAWETKRAKKAALAA